MLVGLTADFSSTTTRRPKVQLRSNNLHVIAWEEVGAWQLKLLPLLSKIAS